MPLLACAGPRAFYACVSLVCIEAQNLIKIKKEAFAYCQNLKAVRMDKLVNIENSFSECYSLQICSFQSAEEINGGAFAGCLSLQELQMPNFKGGADFCIVTQQQNFRFVPELDEKLKNKLIKIQKVEEQPKYGIQTIICKQLADLPCHLKIVTLKSSKVPPKAFMQSQNLQTVIIKNATEIGEEAFAACFGLKQVIGQNISTIKEAGFKECHFLQKIDCSKLISIEKLAFCDCFSLNNLDLSNVKNLAEQSFVRCYSATNVKTCGENEQKVVKQLQFASKDAKIYVGDRHGIGDLGQKVRKLQKQVRKLKRYFWLVGDQ